MIWVQGMALFPATAPFPVCHGSARFSTPLPVPWVRALLCVPASCSVLRVRSLHWPGSLLRATGPVPSLHGTLSCAAGPLPTGPFSARLPFLCYGSAPYRVPRVRSLLCYGSGPYLCNGSGPFSARLHFLCYGSGPYPVPQVRSLLCTAPFPVLWVRSLLRAHRVQVPRGTSCEKPFTQYPCNKLLSTILGSGDADPECGALTMRELHISPVHQLQVVEPCDFHLLCWNVDSDAMTRPGTVLFLASRGRCLVTTILTCILSQKNKKHKRDNRN